jgi:hypothetical protein
MVEVRGVAVRVLHLTKLVVVPAVEALGPMPTQIPEQQLVELLMIMVILKL